MKKNRQDEWLFAAFSAPVEIPSSMQARIDESCETIRRQNRRGKDETMKKTIRKTIRTTLFIAAAAAVLTVSAVAVYQYSLSDALIDTETRFDKFLPGEALSLNGPEDSPEYKAHQEWEQWQADWMANNSDRWEELGVEDTYFETPENYAYYYQACFSDQAEALDAIAAKYGMTLHEERVHLYDEEQFCSMLGVGDIFSDDYEISGEYMYDDGSFKAYCAKAGSTDAEAFFTVKGSFANVLQSLDADCEQWGYTTSSGIQVALARGTVRSYMAAELSGAYLTVCYHSSLTQQELEALAEGIDLKALDKRSAPGEDTSDIAERVAALEEEQYVDTAAVAADIEAEEQAALAQLGDYRITAVPQGYSWSYFNGGTESWFGTYEKPTAYGVQTWLADEGSLNMIILSYFDLSAVSSLPREQQLGEYVEMQKSTMDKQGEWTACKVGGFDAWMNWDGCTTILEWQDTDSGLLFGINWERRENSGFVQTPLEDMIALAESVAEK